MLKNQHILQKHYLCGLYNPKIFLFMQLVFSRFGYLLCIISVLSASIFLLEYGFSELEVLLFAGIGSILFTVIGEFFVPLYTDWRPNFKENFFPDASLFVLNYIVFQSQLLQIFLTSVAIKFAGGGFDLCLLYTSPSPRDS